jgi:glutathione S-transferase
MNEAHWTLRTSMASPFGRKIRMALAAIGRLDDVRIELANTNDPADSLHRQNPLGKIPILIVDEALTLFDSRVIVDFLDQADGRHILLPPCRDRYDVMAQQALADGIMDAALLQLYEVRARPEAKRHDEWMAYQQRKVERALQAFSARLPHAGALQPSIAELALAAALGYLDFRFDGRWRRDHAALEAWLDAFSRRFPAFGATHPA